MLRLQLGGAERTVLRQVQQQVAGEVNGNIKARVFGGAQGRQVLVAVIIVPNNLHRVPHVPQRLGVRVGNNGFSPQHPGGDVEGAVG